MSQKGCSRRRAAYSQTETCWRSNDGRMRSDSFKTTTRDVEGIGNSKAPRRGKFRNTTRSTFTAVGAGQCGSREIETACDAMFLIFCERSVITCVMSRDPKLILI